VKPFVSFIAVLFLSAAFAGCADQATDPQTSNSLVQRRAVPVVNLNASLLDTARFAADQRFGEDRPLTLEDLDGLLPIALTDYNMTLDYVLNMSLYPNLQVTQIGESLEGRAIFGVLLTDDGEYHADRPTIMFTCSQHGNEPSGSEACLIFIEYFTHGTDQFAEDIRTKLNIVINPLANPDGKQANRRGNYEQTDINRDHMNLATLEGRAIHLLANMYRPLIGLDLHEFGGAGAPPPGPASGLPVTTWNTFQVGMPHGAQQADRELYAHNSELMLLINDGMNQEYGYGSSSYYDGGTSVGADPSVHRHHFILRNSYSYLFETGGGLGVVNLPLRVDSHITASFIVINYLLDNMQTMVDNQKTADQTAQQRAAGIQGWAIPPQENTEKAINFLTMHGINFTVLEEDTSYPLTVDYRAGPNTVPAAKSFGNGTIVVSRWQVFGRLANELFEFDDATYYNKGPRAWPLDVYRIMQAP
jgi:hypothetical protein